MIGAAAVALALVAGVPLPILMGIALAWASPWAALACVGVGTLLAGSKGDDHGPDLWLAVAAELKVGNSLRGAFAGAADQEGLTGVSRLAAGGAGMEQLVDLMSVATSDHGAGLRAVVAVASAAGAPSAAAFERLAARQAAEERLRREKRAAMAPALFQAAIVGGIPTVLTILRVRSGGFAGQGALGGRFVMLGFVLVVLGLAVMAFMARRASR